jgi:hypothetical protein
MKIVLILQCGESEDSDVDLMVLSVVTQAATTNSFAIRLPCQIAGQEALFLVDSSSSHSFISDRLAPHLPGLCALPRQQQVRVAGGGFLQCNLMVPQCVWIAGGYDFTTDFKVLPSVLTPSVLTRRTPAAIRLTTTHTKCAYKENPRSSSIAWWSSST